MADKSTYLADAIANHISGHAAYTMPSALYLSLHSTDPTAANVAGTEVSYTGYARQQITPSAVDNGQWSNTNDIFFPANGGSTDVAIDYVGVYDDPTNGNLLYHKQVTAQTMQPTQKIEYAPGAIVITES